jgi:hypothetical protein
MSDEHAFEATSHDGVAVASEVDPEIVEASLESGVLNGYEGNAWHDPVRRALASWAEDTRRGGRRDRTIFARDKFVTPGKVFQQMAMAEDAMDDDVVGGVYDTSEAMAFKKMSMQCEDEDQRDVWNQIAKDINLDSFLRMAWRELFKASNYYGVVWWGQKTYRVRGMAEERKRRKSFAIEAPIALGVLDPTRIVPVGATLFGERQLAWIADAGEQDLFKQVKQDRVLDDRLVSQIIVGPYTPDKAEAEKLQKEDIPVDRLWLLNPVNAWAGSLTKATYERWARVRMKAVFPLLDMKHQLREMDRAFLLGGINFIVLVKKGTDEHPVKKASEITLVAEQMRAQSKSSVIVSDHRLEIEIITPDLENILNPEKWSVLDDRIRLRLWGSIAPPSDTGNRENQITLAKVVSLGIENRRHILKRDLEASIIDATRSRNEGLFDESASLEYAPRRVDLLFDSQVATVFQEIRDRGDLSRETILEEFGFDLSLERQRRIAEKGDDFDVSASDDEIFEAVNVPFNSPDNMATPGGSGRRGGRPPQGPGAPGGGPPDSAETG